MADRQIDKDTLSLDQYLLNLAPNFNVVDVVEQAYYQGYIKSDMSYRDLFITPDNVRENNDKHILELTINGPRFMIAYENDTVKLSENFKNLYVYNIFWYGSNTKILVAIKKNIYEYKNSDDTIQINKCDGFKTTLEVTNKKCFGVIF